MKRALSWRPLLFDLPSTSGALPTNRHIASAFFSFRFQSEVSSSLAAPLKLSPASPSSQPGAHSVPLLFSISFIVYLTVYLFGA